MRGLAGQVWEKAVGGSPTTPGCQKSVAMVDRIGIGMDEEGRGLGHTEASEGGTEHTPSTTPLGHASPRAAMESTPTKQTTPTR